MTCQKWLMGLHAVDQPKQYYCREPPPQLGQGRSPVGNAFWRILKATERTFLHLYADALWRAARQRFGGELPPAQRRTAPAVVTCAWHSSTNHKAYVINETATRWPWVTFRSHSSYWKPFRDQYFREKLHTSLTIIRLSVPRVPPPPITCLVSKNPKWPWVGHFD